MTVIGLAEAKSRLSELVGRVERGEEVTISRYGTAVAKMVPVGRTQADRSAAFGSLKGKLWVAKDFDAPLPDDIQRVFDGYGNRDPRKR